MKSGTANCIQVLFLCFVLSVGHCDTARTQTTGDLRLDEGMNLAGKVHVGNKGLKNVVVSDGYTVTTTDSKGVYRMKRDPRAKFVFVSVPADCAIPAEANIPRFYEKIDHSKDICFVNFQLSKKKKEKKHVLIATADPQLRTDFDAGRFRNETVADINRLTGQYPAGTVFYGLVLGDLVWDQFDMYPAYKEAVEKLPFPVYQAIGNHDHDLKVDKDDDRASHVFEENFGPAYYSFNRGNCHYVVLDDIDYEGRKTYTGRISEAQLRWLKQDLSYVDKSKLIIAGMHIPAWYRNNRSIANADSLYLLLKDYPKVQLLAGHTHSNFHVTVAPNVSEHVAGTACGVFWADEVSGDGCPNGYAVYEIDGARIKNAYFKSTKSDRSVQMRLYPTGTEQSYPDCVVMNIWNWDEGWAVKIYEDGQYKGAPTQYEGYDPYTRDALSGPEKPKYRPSTEPKKTEYMFRYRPERADAVVKVVVVDNWGNIYTDEIKANQR